MPWQIQQTDRSLIYPLVRKACELAERASLLSQARRVVGRYLAVEVLILLSIAIECVGIVVYWSASRWVQTALLVAVLYRAITMGLAQISILLLGSGKSTPGERVHSRLRYLTLTFLNFVEIVLIGTIVQLAVIAWTKSGFPYVGVPAGVEPTPWFEVVFSNFQIASLAGLTAVEPLTGYAMLHVVLIATLGFEMVAVVLSIMLAISPEDEVTGRASRSLDGVDYWNWRARRFRDNPLSRDLEIQRLIADKVEASGALRAVDVGCGPGRTARSLASRGLQVWGVDHSAEMIAAAQDGASDAISWLQADAGSIPLPSGGFDAVVMRMCLHNVMPTWESAVREARRLLRDEGVLVVAESFPPDDRAREFHNEITGRIHARHYFTSAQLQTALADAGFDRDDHSVLRSRMSVKDWLDSATPNADLRRSILQDHITMGPDLLDAYEASVDDRKFDVTISVRTEIFVYTKTRRPLGVGT